MRKTDQFFVKGINQRFTKERSVPERLAEMQNARLFVRNESGFVSRIEGFENLLNDDDYSDIKAMVVVGGKHKTKSYKRGYLLEFTEVIRLLENGFLDGFNSVEVDDLFSLNKISTSELNIINEIIIIDSFRKRIIPFKNFIDEISLDDRIRTNNFFKLSFEEGVDIRDVPLEWPE